MVAAESGGRMVSSSDSTLAEHGFFQVAANTEKEFGVPSGTRFNPEYNTWLGLLELNAESKRLLIKYPALVQDATWDMWFLARLCFSIGRGGTYSCIDRARQAGYVAPGAVYFGVKRWANDTGAVPLGSQSASTVLRRINLIYDELYPVGQNVSPGFPGPAVLPPVPQGINMSLPKALDGKLTSDNSSILFALAAALAAAWFYFRG